MKAFKKQQVNLTGMTVEVEKITLYRKSQFTKPKAYKI